MSDSNSQNSNLQSVEILGLIKSERYSTAIEKIRAAREHDIQLFIDTDLLHLAFNEVIAKKREDRDFLVVIRLYHEMIKLTPNQLSNRFGYFESLVLYLKERQNELSKNDWNEVIQLLTWQNNFLKLIGEESELSGLLELGIGQFIEYENRTERVNGSEVEEFIQEVKITFLNSIPAEESLDYAAQIIFSSKP